MSPEPLLGSAGPGSRAGTAQRGLISSPPRHGGGDAGSGKFLGLETFTPPFLENELDLDELLGDQRKGKGIVAIDFVIIFVLKQRDVPPN